jgi:tRNA pseudouridine38-40 synthase
VVLNAPMQPALLRNSLTWEAKELSVAAMTRAVTPLIGEHDFSSFRAARCHSTTPWRYIYYIDIFRVGDVVVFEICANAFLLHMVRNIIGALLVVGREEQGSDWIAELLSLRDRTKSPMTAPAAGLYLVGVEYPLQFEMPAFKAGPCLVDRVLNSTADRPRPRHIMQRS